MMEPDGKSYNLFKLLNKEINFDVEVSKMPCGISADLKLVAMNSDGGVAKYNGNTADAAFGTGYCDASCPRDLRFINGQEGDSETTLKCFEGKVYASQVTKQFCGRQT